MGPGGLGPPGRGLDVSHSATRSISCLPIDVVWPKWFTATVLWPSHSGASGCRAVLCGGHLRHLRRSDCQCHYATCREQSSYVAVPPSICGAGVVRNRALRSHCAVDDDAEHPWMVEFAESFEPTMPRRPPKREACPSSIDAGSGPAWMTASPLLLQCGLLFPHRVSTAASGFACESPTVSRTLAAGSRVAHEQ